MNKSEEKDDIEGTLKKIPTSHRKLVQGYNWKLQGGNTLKGDGEHIGYVDRMEKEIAVAAPWNYGREFTILHEIGHQVWDHLPIPLKKEWFNVVANTKGKKQKQSHDPQSSQNALKQSPEELFCMSYACYYAKHKIETFDYEEWMNFISKIPS